ncbi:MAG: response regulator, partial [Burkholderiales bacterium]|nr:response regulator [Burkholderiales bacterium]
SVQVLARTEQGVRLRFVVADTGIGIAPEQQAHIFSGFSQAESSTARRFGGTGLGLSICVRLVGLMGGALQLESQPGQGSRFSFELPFGVADALPATEPATPQVPEPLKGLRLLVVEDNAVNRQVAQELLEAEGAQVFLAEDGAAGVAAVAAAATPFDLVLMDLQMPVMDGFEATREIRRLPGGDALPIVAMTANALASDREASLAAGLDDHVGKPFELDQLVATVLRHAGRAVVPAAGRAAPAALPADALAWAGEQGIDLVAAVDRLGGRADIWSSSARGVAADLAAQAGTLQQLLAGGDLAAATRLAHTLKGVGATVGASALSASAAATERLLKAAAAAAGAGAGVGAGADGAAPADAPAAAPPAGALAAAVAALQARMHEAAAALARLGDWLAPAPPSQADAQRDAQALLRALPPLTALLRDQDMAATDLHAEIVQAHAAHWSAELRPLADAMAALDFPAGVRACEQLAQALASAAEEMSA